MIQLDSFTRAYIVCALWSSTDSDKDDEPLDRDHDSWDLSDKCRARMVADCKAFQESNADVLAESGLSDEQAGHDFWLTRNGHGTGFWDCGLDKALTNRLIAACKVVGGVDLYVGDDGYIHIM